MQSQPSSRTAAARRCGASRSASAKGSSGGEIERATRPGGGSGSVAWPANTTTRLPQQGFVEIGANARVTAPSLKDVADWIDDEKERIGERAFRERGFNRRWTIAPKRERFRGRG